MNEKHARHRPWALIILSVVAMVYHFFLILAERKVYVPLDGDAAHYDHSAIMLLTKHVYTYWGQVPEAQVTPGYPLFLEFAYWFTGVNSTGNHETGMHLAVAFQHLLAALSVVLLYLLMRKFLPTWISFVGAILWLFYPTVSWAADQLLTETLYVFLLILFTWSFINCLQKPALWRFAFSGICLGLTTLVRPSVLPLVVAPALLLLRREARNAMWSYIKYWAVYVAGFVIVMLPWWIRNLVVLHKLILTDEDMGNPLLFGADPHFETATKLGYGLSSKQQEHLALQMISKGFHEHPLTYLKWYTIDKLGLLFNAPWYETSVGSNATPLAKFWFDVAHLHIVWIILGAIGLFIGAFVPYLRWISLLVLFLIVAQLPFIPINRYMYPTMPFFFVGVMTFVWFVGRKIFFYRQTVTN